MKLTKCESGHFYDGEKYPECPYCNTALQSADAAIVTAQPAEDAPAQGAAPAEPAGPVAGWLVALSGEACGRDFRLEEGRNLLGVDPAGAPCLLGADAALSRRQLVVVYDPQTGRFTAQPGSSRQLSYVNGKSVLEVTPLAAGDEVCVGDALLRFVPFCGEFRWDRPAKKQAAPQKPSAAPKKTAR